MARQIITLDQSLGDGVRSINCVFWYPVSGSTRLVPRPGFTSRATGVTAQEQADLESGAVVEEYQALLFPNTYTTAEMKAFVLKRYQDRAAAVAAAPAARAFWGVYYDSGTGWSA